ncbi:glutamate 5-kinase [Candidatus Woesearchaeota archaeon]|nr:glutamate 5-kinase [Candidatus Woesearchaeota archaeon]
MVVFLVRSQFEYAKRIVVKLGTSTVVDSVGSVNKYNMSNIVQDIKRLDREFVIVSSGAIGLGNSVLGLKRSSDLILNQASAAVGQCLLMEEYRKAFSGMQTAQLLLTNSDLNNAEKRVMVRSLIERLLGMSIIPIINENDSVCTEEISFGDNDILSGNICAAIGANMQILLTDVNGIYKNLSNEDRIKYITKADAEVNEIKVGCSSQEGTGGISSKLLSAKIASRSNTITVVARGSEKDIINKIISGMDYGTILCIDGV